MSDDIQRYILTRTDQEPAQARFLAYKGFNISSTCTSSADGIAERLVEKYYGAGSRRRVRRIRPDELAGAAALASPRRLAAFSVTHVLTAR